MTARSHSGPKQLLRWLRRRWQGRATVATIHAAVMRMDARMERTERLLRRVQRDAERIKLHAGAVLGTDRALALLATGDRIYVDPRDGGCGINLLSEGRYEEDELRLFRRFLKPGGQVLDIGANYGIYSITAAPYLRPGGRVIAFEPNPHVQGLLWSSLHLNGFFDVVDAQRIGASDTNGTLRFAIDEASPGGAHVLAPGDEPPPDQRIIDVPVTRIDDRLPTDMIVDLVKIDVEGHEERVLRGMQAVIARSPDIRIFMELFYPLFRNDGDFVALLRFITDELGLTIHRIGAGGTIEPADASALRGQTCNLILSKGAIRPMPDLTIHPVQLFARDHARIEAGALMWERPAAGRGQVIAHGPYVYLPKGRYRLVIDGDFEGDFTCRILENYGDPIWEGAIEAGQGYAAEVVLPLDAPRMEIAFLSRDRGSSRLVVRRIEFWPA